MSVIDCFMFWNEIELLYMRLDILYDFVDYFIICEAKISHSGKVIKSEYLFNKHKKLYDKFVDKIIFLPFDESEFTGVGDTAINTNTWPNENKQRKWLFNEIEKFSGDTLVSISDVDEIWDPSKLESIKKNVETHKVCGTNQILTYYYVNCIKEQQWNGTFFVKRKDLTFEKIQILRNKRCLLPSYLRCGWHFSWLGDIERLQEKFDSIAEHDIIQQYSTKDNIEHCITNHCDLFHRKGILGKIKIINIDDNSRFFPIKMREYIKKFPEIYYHI